MAVVGAAMAGVAAMGAPGPGPTAITDTVPSSELVT